MLNLRFVLFIVLALSFQVAYAESFPKVHLVRTPDGGIQPQADVDPQNVMHLIYYKGDPRSGDIYYTRKSAERFSDPVRVNSTPGTAIAAGTIRGGQIAVGKNGRIHVIWNGNDFKSGSSTHEGAPLFYTRLNDAGTAFEPQRDLITYAAGLDGGSSVAADDKENVYAVWHAHAPDAPAGEKGRGVFVSRSTDNGKSFSRETQVNPADTGVCACCGLRAFADRKGGLFIFYRAAFDVLNRDGMLLGSKNGGAPFHTILRHNWKVGACPMSSASFGQSHVGPVAAWETAGNVYWSSIDSSKMEIRTLNSPSGGGNRKHPVATANHSGQILLAWVEGSGWQKGGKLAWQVFSADGRPLGNPGGGDGVPVWSFVTAAAQNDGSFTIIY